ncbi:MAG: hypothetical protein RSD74_12915 [Angelakisella sp.]
MDDRVMAVALLGGFTLMGIAFVIFEIVIIPLMIGASILKRFLGGKKQ